MVADAGRDKGEAFSVGSALLSAFAKCLPIERSQDKREPIQTIFDYVLKAGYIVCMELITVQQAATQASVSEKAIYYALSAGNLTRHEQFGRMLIDVAELQAYRPRAGAGRLSRRADKMPATMPAHAPETAKG